jgi:hypothetical protein
MTKRERAEKIYDTISGSPFGNFYGKVEEGDNCPFSLHLEGAEDCLTHEQVIDRIISLFSQSLGD